MIKMLQATHALLSPAGVALLIVFAVGIAGSVMAILLAWRKYAGYKEIADDARQIARVLGGNVFRDGDDLVVAGNLQRLPTVLRFSRKESVPGLNLRVGVPANFTLWIAPKTADVNEGQAPLRTNDPQLDARFAARSDHPAQAKLFLGMPAVTDALRQIACSSSTFAHISEGWLEISELDIPAHTAKHVLQHLQSVTALSETIKRMPGADAIAVVPVPRERHILGRASIAIGLLAAILLVVTAMKEPTKTAADAPAFTPPVPAGMRPSEAALITRLDGWRVASPEDFNPDAAGWLRDREVPVSGRVVADFSGKGTATETAYVLIGNQGERRIVLLIQGQDRYDTRYPSVAIAARVPMDRLSGIEWAGSAPERADGDGLLIVRSASDMSSGVVLFVSGHRILSAAPANYQQVNLQ